MDDKPTLTHDELVELVAFALWKHLDLRPRKRSLDDARIWARYVVEHLELSRVEWNRKPPTPPHTRLCRQTNSYWFEADVKDIEAEYEGDDLDTNEGDDTEDKEYTAQGFGNQMCMPGMEWWTQKHN